MKKHSVNYISLLTTAIERLSKDHSLNPSHISLYIALFYQWNINRFNNPLSVTRSEAMVVSKIGSKSTYHKCMRDLHDKEYLIYFPSHNPMKGSLIEMSIFETTSRTTSRTTTKQVVGQALVPSINSINKTNKINKTNIESANSHLPLEQKRNNKKIVFQIPSLSELENFFMENHHSVLEANRFFNHFQSNGWLIGGRSKMKDWKAAARNWMSRSKEYNKPVDPNPLSAEINKNYSEPL